MPMMFKNTFKGTSLVAQWLRIHLPMQGTRVQVRSRAHEPQLLSPRATTTEAHAPRARALQQEKPPQ